MSINTSCCEYNKNIPFLNFISKRLSTFGSVMADFDHLIQKMILQF
ncbi:hypothetical protein AQPE_2682 [Aquipluma nitroreducens]|uniref:Uncharacterized protein n=1 Tax=Aquipluma nitroreducens TaxID=2010828 RepID=A0A5K7SAD0_9BACT|nr:hypothetical protein AQPE_2682 [Aquipluma nitroreducens]